MLCSLFLRYSFLFIQSVILFNLPFVIICFSLILYARFSLHYLFKISSTFCINHFTPNRKNANPLLRRTCFFPVETTFITKDLNKS